MSNLYLRWAQPVCAEAGVVGASGRHKSGLHTLRHAAASLFIKQGFSAKRVLTVMGYSSIAVAFDIYGHLFRRLTKRQCCSNCKRGCWAECDTGATRRGLSY